MKGAIEVRMDLPPSVVNSIVKPMELEAVSSPPGGSMKVLSPENGGIVLLMDSGDISTLRAMLNSYLGLVSVAVRAAR